jgi:hypothetical protein
MRQMTPSAILVASLRNPQVKKQITTMIKGRQFDSVVLNERQLGTKLRKIWQAHLEPLPNKGYDYNEWKQALVSADWPFNAFNTLDTLYQYFASAGVIDVKSPENDSLHKLQEDARAQYKKRRGSQKYSKADADAMGEHMRQFHDAFLKALETGHLPKMAHQRQENVRIYGETELTVEAAKKVLAEKVDVEAEIQRMKEDYLGYVVLNRVMASEHGNGR